MGLPKPVSCPTILQKRFLKLSVMQGPRTDSKLRVMALTLSKWSRCFKISKMILSTNLFPGQFWMLSQSRQNRSCESSRNCSTKAKVHPLKYSNQKSNVILAAKLHLQNVLTCILCNTLGVGKDGSRWQDPQWSGNRFVALPCPFRHTLVVLRPSDECAGQLDRRSMFRSWWSGRDLLELNLLQMDHAKLGVDTASQNWWLPLIFSR